MQEVHTSTHIFWWKDTRYKGISLLTLHFSFFVLIWTLWEVKKSESRVKRIKRELDRNLFTFSPGISQQTEIQKFYSSTTLQQLEQAKNLLKYSKSKCIVQMSQHQRFFSYCSLHSFPFPSSVASGVYMSTWVILHISIHTKY